MTDSVNRCRLDRAGNDAEARPRGGAVIHFNVAIANADKAVAATAKRATVADQAHIRHVRQLSSVEIAALHLKAVEVKPA
jgi:hypothetical protein